MNTQSAGRVVGLLAASVGLMMTGFGIIMPVFARRLGELGGGVGTLGIMTMSFALAHMVLSPRAFSSWSRLSSRCWPCLAAGLQSGSRPQRSMRR